MLVPVMILSMIHFAVADASAVAVLPLKQCSFATVLVREVATDDTVLVNPL